MDWSDALRLLAVVGLAYGAWQGWRAMPRRIVVARRSYYRQPDGRFATTWGRRVRDPALAAELERLHQARQAAEESDAHAG